MKRSSSFLMRAKQIPKPVRLKQLGVVLLMAVLVLTLSSCVPGDGNADTSNPAGFFWGIWHGWLAPLSLIISIFRDEISIYEIHNTGLGYDFGYYMAIISGFGGLSLARRRKKDD